LDLSAHTCAQQLLQALPGVSRWLSGVAGEDLLKARFAELLPGEQVRAAVGAAVLGGSRTAQAATSALLRRRS
jgi:hypothetical protein